MSGGRKTKRQLERDIASSLTAQGQPQLAAMFADPEARKIFARELRHEIQKKQIAAQTAAGRAARPFTVKRVEEIGGRRVRSIVGNYATEAEARVRADQLGGWIERRDDGQVVYGRSHATIKKTTKPRPTPYRIKLAPRELSAVEFARGRYAWADMLAAHAAEDGSIAFTESEMWQWTDDVDSDTAGGHSPFPLASGAFAEKLQRFYDERI